MPATGAPAYSAATSTIDTSPGLSQELLHRAQVGDQQVVVLRAGGPQDAGDREAAAADAHVVAHRQAERAGRLGAGHELVAVGRRPARVHRPPALELELGGRAHAQQQDAAALHLHRADELRGDDRDARAVGDGVDARDVGLGESSARPRTRRPRRCRRRSAPTSLLRGATRMLAPKLCRLALVWPVIDCVSEIERHHRGDADQQARDEERRAGLAATQVAHGDGPQPHAIAPFTARAARRWGRAGWRAAPGRASRPSR